jgi:hypothetical protein
MASLRNTSIPKPTGAGIANLQPSLRMSDGGMFGALKSAIGLKQDSPELAAYKARAAAEREAAKNPPKVARETPAPMGSQSVLDGRMKAAGLREGGQHPYADGQGGEVPGDPKQGDVFDAKYTGGEFVVSNAMLKKEPSLRDELHSLRTEVLAEKGMTPEEADAKAVSGGLRAEVGGRYKLDEFGNPTGVSDGQNQTGVAGVQPANQGSNNLSGGLRPAVGGAGNRSGELTPTRRLSYGENLRRQLPGTSAVVQGTMDDVSRDLQGGNTPRAIMKGLRGSAALIPAVLDDTVGAGVRGAYGMLRNPVEDAGRVLLNMEDRPEPTSLRTPSAPYTPSAAAFNPAARVLRQGGTPALPSGPAAPTNPFGTKTPATLQDYGQVDQNAETLRVAQGRDAFARDKALADGMEAERLAKDQAGVNAQDANVQFGLRAQAKLDQERARKNAETSASSMINDGARRTGRDTLAKLNAQDLEGTKQAGETLRNAATNATSLRNAQTQADSYRYTADSNLRGDIYKTDGAARSARASGLREQANKDREFEASQGKQTFEQRQAARKAMDDRIATKFVDKEGKPDLARAADFKDSVSVTLGALAAEARAKGDIKRAERLAKADYSSLDSEDEAMIQQLFDAKEAARQNAGFFNGKFVDDKNLLSFRPAGVRQNLVMSSNVRTQNGSELNMNDARQQGWWGGPGSSNLDPYLSEAQRLRGTQGR